MNRIEQIYQQHIKPIPIVEQSHLIDFIMQTYNKPSLEKSSNANWRDTMSEKVKILVSEDELIQPMTDIWKDYI
jgi:predicted transcriptional regulator